MYSLKGMKQDKEKKKKKKLLLFMSNAILISLMSRLIHIGIVQWLRVRSMAKESMSSSMFCLLF